MEGCCVKLVKDKDGHHIMTPRSPEEVYNKLRRYDRRYRNSLFRVPFDRVLDGFMRSDWVWDQARSHYIIPNYFFFKVADKFKYFLRSHATLNVLRCVIFLGPSTDSYRFLFSLFLEICHHEFPNEVEANKNMMESANLTKPETWFPTARSVKRLIIYHHGPTNSGKTYSALERFMHAEKAIYCSPLRLLAMEVFDRVSAFGIDCNLITGQEKKVKLFSNHTSCTIEMASTDEKYNIAIIDEIQMACDNNRGHSWTKALLGLKADEIHLCGDQSALKLVTKICEDLGDDLEVKEYHRLKALDVEAESLLNDLKKVRAGDCIITFTRRKIFELKRDIEKLTQHRCCVIYGALPSDTRLQQAKLFNEEDNEYDILIATDAVGMGLNLNIRRVVFSTVSKYDGFRTVNVPSSQVKQIAGRAGRRGSQYPKGLCTTLFPSDLKYLKECLNQPLEDMKQMGLFPLFEQVENFARQASACTFPEILSKFKDVSCIDDRYFMCHFQQFEEVARMLEDVSGLSLKDRFNFCLAPVFNTRDPDAMHLLHECASLYSEKNVPVTFSVELPTVTVKNDSDLMDMERKHRRLSMYLWLSQQLDTERFTSKEEVEMMIADISAFISKYLLKLNICQGTGFQKTCLV